MEEDMELKKIIVIGFAISCLLISAVACEKEGTAEKAGKEIDRALDSAKEKLDEATK
jgi:hypothetical protein